MRRKPKQSPVITLTKRHGKSAQPAPTTPGRKKPGPKPFDPGKPVNNRRPVMDAKLDDLLFRWLLAREATLKQFRVSPEWIALHEALVSRIAERVGVGVDTIVPQVQRFLGDLAAGGHAEYEVGADSLFLVEWADSISEALSPQDGPVGL